MTTRHNDKYALIGKTENGDKVYIQKASYDCDWYFGFGYINVFEPNKQEPTVHTHWDHYFTGSSHVQPENIKEKLSEVKIDEDSLWRLCDLMKTFYTLKEASGVYERGNSHLTGDTHGMLTDEEMKKNIDLDTVKVIREVQELLGFEKPDQIKTLPSEYQKEVAE